VGELGNDEVHIANYYDAEGHRLAQKIRTVDKRFHWRGDPQHAVLFGQHLWRPVPVYSDAELDGHGRHAHYLKKRTRPPGPRLILTEGEVDAMSVAQVLGMAQPVVSVPSGAAGALGAVRKNFDWIAQFHEIVFLFDQDEAGEKAATECAALLADRARIGRLPAKDANDLLVAGREVELVRAIHEARLPVDRR
jgi:twinkle protein